ncbi:serine hydrolase domain-containing protein [Microbulbifer sp. 2304DJ12-6]|uniref:serine hydrolase domain-containing protein n=1 Tax=Microbulbifer sp. 2304DJ12-6 TaxID=3233340 RepID=UPI0039B0FE30
MNHTNKVYLFRCAIVLFFVCFAMDINALVSLKADRIDKYLSDNVRNGVSGSILVVQDNIDLINKGYGLADREEKLANSPSTVFDIGSLTKQFTAAAILKLAEQQKLRLTDSLDVYFKNISSDKKQITIHQLLTHTAGFQEYPGGDFDLVSKASYFETVFSSKLRFEPGSRYEYSNVGYSVLSAIIEQVTKTGYETFLSQEFFKTLNMTHTGYVLPDWNNVTLAHGYYEDFYDRGTSIERYRKNSVSPILVGNGGIQSTVSDLRKWVVALDEHRVLSEKSTQLLTKKHVETPTQVDAFQSSTFYGYGWKIGSSNYSDRVISHNGNNGVYRSSIIWRPEEGVFVIFLANTESKGILWLGYEIDKMLAEPDYLPKPIKLNPYRAIDEYVKKTKPVSGVTLLENFGVITESGV